MSKITIPKEAMKYATRLSSNDKEFYINSNKFADIMHQHYPHLSRHKIDEINYQITLKGIKVSTLMEIQASKKKEMLETYKRYLNYKKRGDYKNLSILENNYKALDKKSYDFGVDRLKEFGYNTKYAPKNVMDIKKFYMFDINQLEIQTFIISSIIIGSIGLLYLL